MRVATWNVNSIKVRLAQVLDWLGQEQADVLGLQETKVTDENFPREKFEESGYSVVVSGQPAYNGVALLARAPMTDVVRELPGFDDDQRRVLAATSAGVRIINLYVPNGQSVGSDKYAYKLAWLEALGGWLGEELAAHPDVLVMGDFNIAPEPRDVHDPAAWEGKVLFSEPERRALGRLMGLGLTDLFRLFEQPENSYSWWDYRAAAFRRNRGLRIDLMLASEALTTRCTACRIDREPRRLQRPSDHAPVVAAFNKKLAKV